MNNEQLSTDLANDIKILGINPDIGDIKTIILDALNAVTGETEVLLEHLRCGATKIKVQAARIKALNDALKPFAIHYNDETAGLQKKPAGRLVLSGDYTVIHACHFRTAAKVYEEG